MTSIFNRLTEILQQIAKPLRLQMSLKYGEDAFKNSTNPQGKKRGWGNFFNASSDIVFSFRFYYGEVKIPPQKKTQNQGSSRRGVASMSQLMVRCPTCFWPGKRFGHFFENFLTRFPPPQKQIEAPRDKFQKLLRPPCFPIFRGASLLVPTPACGAL